MADHSSLLDTIMNEIFVQHTTRTQWNPPFPDTLTYSTLTMSTEISRQQASETQNLLDREAQHVTYQHKDLHQKIDATKERTQTVLTGRQRVNEMTKKFMKTE